MTEECALWRHLDVLEFLSSSLGMGGEPRAILESFLDNWGPTEVDRGDRPAVDWPTDPQVTATK